MTARELKNITLYLPSRHIKKSDQNTVTQAFKILHPLKDMMLEYHPKIFPKSIQQGTKIDP